MVPTLRFVVLLAASGLVLLLVPLARWWILVALVLDALLVAAAGSEWLWLGAGLRLQVSRRVRSRMSVLRPVEVRIHVENRGRVSVRVRVRDTLPAAFQADRWELEGHVPAGGALDLSYRATPLARGDHAFGRIALWVEGGLGLVALRRMEGEGEVVRAYPDLEVLREFENLTRRRHLAQMGIRTVRRLGSGREFDRLREYQPDDEYRHVNWKATARRSRPISSVYQTERGQDVLLALDTSFMMGLEAGAQNKLDHAVAAALLLAKAALHFEDNVGLLIFDSQVRSFLPPRRGHTQMAKIVHMLYGVRPAPSVGNYRDAFRFIRARYRKRALVVLLTDLLDEAHAREILRHLPVIRRSHLPLVVTVSDASVQSLAQRMPRDVREAYEAVVAEELVTERANLLRAMEHQGALVLDTPASSLAMDTVNTYLRVKAAQLL